MKSVSSLFCVIFALFLFNVAMFSAQVAVAETNLVEYVFTVPAHESNKITASRFVNATLIFSDWVDQYNCFNSSSARANYAPITKPYNVNHVYATNVNLTNPECLAISSTALDDLSITITASLVTTTFDDDTCVNTSNNTIACSPTACSQYIKCNTGLYSSCEDNADVCTDYSPKLTCATDAIDHIALCVVNSASSLGLAAPLAILAVVAGLMATFGAF